MKHSLSWRFNLSAISVITLILVSFGVFDYTRTSSNLNEQIDNGVRSLAASLQNIVPPALWNYETGAVDVALQSAIEDSSVVGVMVLEGDSLVSAYVKGPDGIEPSDDVDRFVAQGQSFPLEFVESGTPNDVGELLLMKNNRIIAQRERSAIIQTFVQILILDILVAVALRYLVSRLVKSPIKEIAEAMQDISSGEGDLSQRLRIRRNDEIGQVATHFNSFVEKIQKSMQLVGESSEQVRSTVEQVRGNAQDNLSTVTRVQEDTEQVATAITEMNSTSHEVAANAQQVSDSAQIADKETKDTQSVVIETSNSIEVLAKEIEAGAKVMSNLKGDVNGIVSVLDTIRGIAEQTNLLALNAAIEAARAGDQGRGFAVVADEVRALAARTQESTGEIQTMIEKLESGSDQAVQVMERSTQSSNDTVERVQQALASLEKINESISQINDMSTQIATAVEEQTHVSEEINKNVTNIATAVQSNADSAADTAKATEELSGNAKNLADLVGQFKLY